MAVEKGVKQIYFTACEVGHIVRDPQTLSSLVAQMRKSRLGRWVEREAPSLYLLRLPQMPWIALIQVPPVGWVPPCRHSILARSGPTTPSFQTSLVDGSLQPAHE